MDVKQIAAVKMKIARSPRELDQLRNATRMNIYLEVKALTEKACPGRFSKADCARVAVELANQLCGEHPSAGSPTLTPEMTKAMEEMRARIVSKEPELCIAASFVRWSRAVGMLMILKNEDAEVELKAAIELNPRNAFAHCSLAYLAGFQGDAKQAIALAKKALELDPGLAEAWIELGNAYEATGEHNLAMAAWEKAQSLNPDIIHARNKPDSSSPGLPGRDRPDSYEVLTDEPES
jgi:tetratricopeptide (TPR) repeat protein